MIWHDLECGSYVADLPLWRELAAAPGAQAAAPGAQAAAPGAQAAAPGAHAVLDIGAGTGRVALDLAHRGHRVTAVEHDAELLRALRERAAAMGLQALEPVCADARALALARTDYELCIVPMQTIQLFGGAAGRTAFLRGARAHLAVGGVLACAIVTDVEPFDCAAADVGPTAEVAHVDGASYISRATRVHVGRSTLRIERERTIVPAPGAASNHAPTLEHDAVELDRLSVARLQREGRQAGLTVLDTRAIPATDEHEGSVAVIFRA
ncbi:MAG TPA: methyltransferase domain-containing protein [Solirubrobacteraceae bacterium]|nr:methyltransferase domain-containing protein [Solirubrobacteraceae bacterium]